MVEFLSACVKARINMVISGGTGSGKTTLLNALSAFIPDDERVATIEDAAELRLQQPHVVRMETRPANIEGTGEVTTRDLVRNALRMRPDRIIVGECRGAEALDMLQAMNTGHDGSMTTIHANDTRDALSRLEMMVGMAGLRPADLDHPPPDRLGHPDRRPGGPPAAAASARSSRSRRSPAWRGTSSACTTCSASSRPGVDEERRGPGLLLRHRASGRKCLERLEVAGIRLPLEMFERRMLDAPDRPGGDAVIPAPRDAPDLLAVVTAIVGVYSIVSDLFLRDRSRVSRRVDDEFRKRQRERARKSLLFKDLGQLGADAEARRRREARPPRSGSRR